MLAPYLIEYVMRAPQLTEAFIALYFVPQLALTPVWIWLSRRVGKKRRWLAAMLTGFALQLVGFVPNAEQSELARTTLLALSGCSPAAATCSAGSSSRASG